MMIFEDFDYYLWIKREIFDYLLRLDLYLINKESNQNTNLMFSYLFGIFYLVKEGN